jgi:hypothetical protein
MKMFIRIVFTASMILACAAEVFPCTCSSPGVREKFRSADVVFVGSVTAISPASPDADFPLAMHTVKFKVEKLWKGPRNSEITAVADYDQRGWCGDLDLAVGEKYLIYADRQKGRLRIQTDCGPNMNVRYAAGELKRLNGFWFRLFARVYPYPAL